MIASYAFPRRASRGEVLFLAGDSVQGLYILVRGAVRSLRHSPDGREQLLSVERPISALGDLAVLDGRGYCTSIIADQESDFLFVRRDDFWRICSEHPAVLCQALQLVTARARAYADLVEALSLHDVNRRVAWFLLRESAQRGMTSGNEIVFELTWTHQQIASHLGTVREMVTRAFTYMHKAGLIHNQGRLITISDHRALREYANT